MRVRPDGEAAARDQQAVQRAVAGVLVRAGLVVADPSAPGVIAIAHGVQRAAQTPDWNDRVRADWQHRLDRTTTHTRSPAPVALWAVDLAAPDAALRAAVRRARASVPAGHPGVAEVSAWQAEERIVFVRTVAELATAWPQMLAELRRTVTRVALLEGDALNGFTDFAAHGAVFLNRTRLTDLPGGLPGWARLAEALVHEGTHTRCNAAAFSTPFLKPAAGEVAPVRTPLRADPRPLAGLFQQLAVLVRCTLLHGHLAERHDAPGDPAGGALRARRSRLLDRAGEAASGLNAHRGVLTPEGREVLDEALGLLHVLHGDVHHRDALQGEVLRGEVLRGEREPRSGERAAR